MKSARKRWWIKEGRHLGMKLQHLQNRRKNIDEIFRNKIQRSGRKVTIMNNHKKREKLFKGGRFKCCIDVKQGKN